MNILLKGLTETQAKVLISYFEHELLNDSELWINEYCKDIKFIDVNEIKYKNDLIEVNLITFKK